MRAHQAFSLLELLLSIVLLGMVIAVLHTMNARTHTEVASAALQIRGIELGQSYLDEILSKRYDELTPLNGRDRCGETGQPSCTLAANFGPDSTETRVSFDDIDDYHQLVERPTNVDGNLLPNYSDRWQVTVAISYAGSSMGFAHDQQLKRIHVNVTYLNSDLSLNFSAYRGNF